MLMGSLSNWEQQIQLYQLICDLANYGSTSANRSSFSLLEVHLAYKMSSKPLHNGEVVTKLFIVGNYSKYLGMGL